jgi:putative endonuclease
VYWEEYGDTSEAIAREKQLKKWRREKKDQLIASQNPTFGSLNNEIGVYIGW